MMEILLLEGFNSSSILWQSFDYLTDTLLPGAYEYNSIVLTSWKNPNDPAFGSSAAYIYNDDLFVDMIADQSNNILLVSNRYIL